MSCRTKHITAMKWETILSTSAPYVYGIVVAPPGNKKLILTLSKTKAPRHLGVRVQVASLILIRRKVRGIEPAIYLLFFKPCILTSELCCTLTMR